MNYWVIKYFAYEAMKLEFADSSHNIGQILPSKM